MSGPDTADAAPDTAEERLYALRARAAATRHGEAAGWPRERGNVWMLDRKADGRLHYMSDCYGGRVMGFEEIDGIALAQTPPLALAMIALGGHVGIARPLPETFEWHGVVADDTGALNGRGGCDGARAQGVAAQRLAERDGRALRTIALVAAPQASTLKDDAAFGGALVTACLASLKSTTKALTKRGKTVFADRLSLRLLEGAPMTGEREASDHYADTAQMLTLGIARPLPETFEWHGVVADDTGALNGCGGCDGARAQGVAAQRLAERDGRALRTIALVAAPQASTVKDDAASGGALVTACLASLKSTTKAMTKRGKTVFADRLSLRLLDGAPKTGEREASDHYADTAQMLTHEIAQITGQNSRPLTVVSQSSAGSVALAEGRLDIDHPTLGFVVATPQHAFASEPDRPAVPTPHARMLMDELEAIAVATVQDGGRWYCPRLRQAWRQGKQIIAEFSALGPLAHDGDVTGFGFSGGDAAPDIRKVTIHGTFAVIDIAGPLEGDDVYLTYAWSPDDPVSGNLRDDWSSESILAPGETLHRYALSCRTRIMISDLFAKEAKA